MEFRRVIRKGTGIRPPGTSWTDNEFLPIEERWSARFFKPEDVFAPLNLDEAHLIEVDHFYNINSWEEYVSFISASKSLTIKKPESSILLRSSYNKVGGSGE